MLWFILSHMHFHLLALNMFCSLNYRCNTQQGRCCRYLPSNAEGINGTAPATEPWLMPETLLFGVFFLRGCLIPSLMHQAGQEPVNALNPVCCWMVPQQASRASQRQGEAWHLRSLLRFCASSYQMVCTAPGATDFLP